MTSSDRRTSGKALSVKALFDLTSDVVVLKGLTIYGFSGAGSTVTGNGTGLSQQLAHTFESFGNNHVRGNGTPTTGGITLVGNN